MLILDEPAIQGVISMKESIEALRAGYACYDKLEGCPPRTLIRDDENKATFGVMPYYSKYDNFFIVKVISHHACNMNKGCKSINGVVVVQEGFTGQIMAQFDAGAITSLRTGATAGLATDLLAREPSAKLAVIGTGAQAMAALNAVLCVRDIKSVAVHSRNQHHVERFIVRAVDQFARGIVFQGCEDVRSAVENADIVCTATTCAEPLFAARDVMEGVHVNAIGKHTLTSREFPLELVPRSLLVVEDRGAAISEAGSYHRESVSISQLLREDYQRYQSRTTIFSSVGTAFQDACICIAILKKLKRAES
ncbi:ornithine cyclodeaminase family protein [Pseudomonas sp. MPB26]|uniref:ornithine cyclodeaminase family protein n=1 Tax=Pseudomonas sp. MPB26 TaxID=3388491 RepID=UPI003984C985